MSARAMQQRMKITIQGHDNRLLMRGPFDNLSICGAAHADIADVHDIPPFFL